MSEEYEMIFIPEEGRAIKNNKTGKIYHSEFEIIDEKNKQILDLQQKVEQLEKENKEYHKGLFKIKKATFDGKLLLKDVVRLRKEKEQLENIIKEIREYIENNWITYNDSKDFTEFNEELPVFIKEINILLNILNKGSDKGVKETNTNNN